MRKVFYKMKYNLHIVKTKIIGKIMKDKSRLTFKWLNYQLHAAIHLQQQDGVAKLSNEAQILLFYI